jgi:hypothetical protein
MKLELLRNEHDEKGTFGALFLDGNFCCYSGELPWYGNIERRSCIPAGAYRATWRTSPRFGPCYHLAEVPKRSHILIHRGNFCGSILDGFKTETLGCILVGLEIGTLLNQKAVLRSGEAFDRLSSRTRNVDLDVVVRWKHGVNPETVGG